MPNDYYPGGEDAQSGGVADPLALSKRAARRLFQRAFVLAGRDRNVRQHIREARCSILWIIEEWELDWTTIMNKGKIEFARRPAKRPDLTLSWRTAEAFFEQAIKGTRKDDPPAHEGDPAAWKFAQPLYAGFCKALKDVLADPTDESGTRLA